MRCRPLPGDAQGAIVGEQGLDLMQKRVRGGAAGRRQGLGDRPRALSPGGGNVDPACPQAPKGAGRRGVAGIEHA